MSRTRLNPLAEIFAACDALSITLWREGAAIKFQPTDAMTPELGTLLIAHRPEVLAALAIMPGARREPGAHEAGWTSASELLITELPETLRQHEHDRWCADLAQMWGRGVSGREAAREAHANLERRCEAHRVCVAPDGASHALPVAASEEIEKREPAA